MIRNIYYPRVSSIRAPELHFSDSFNAFACMVLTKLAANVGMSVHRIGHEPCRVFYLREKVKPPSNENYSNRLIILPGV